MLTTVTMDTMNTTSTYMRQTCDSIQDTHSHSIDTIYFGKTTSRKSSLTCSQDQELSPQNVKLLRRIRKLSEMPKIRMTTLPTQVSEISQELVLLVIDQLRLLRQETALGPLCKVSSFQLQDCKKSSGDLSTMCRMLIQVEEPGQKMSAYCFIAKLLPADDPYRLYCFEANVFEKEISIYFELLPYLYRQVCHNHPHLVTFFSESIPRCIYASNNQDGVGMLMFECKLQQGFVHPVDPAGLSLEQVCCVVTQIAKLHAIGSVSVYRNHKQLESVYPYLHSNVYTSQTMAEAAGKMFEVYTDFLKCAPGHQVLVDRFEKQCAGVEAARLMYSCMRRQVDNPFNTIVHGELWEKNMLFRTSPKDGKIDCVLLDWKNAKIASATKDLAFLLLSSTTSQLRKESLDIILELYYATFCDTLKVLDAKLSEKVTFKEFYTDYKRSTKGAFLQAVCVLVQEMQFLENQLTDDKINRQKIVETLAVYESRALNMMYDIILTQTHFQSD